MKYYKQTLQDNMDRKLHMINHVANKKIGYNKDINHHIISCRTSLEIIEIKDRIIEDYKQLLETKNNYIMQLEMKNILKQEEIRQKDSEIETQKKIIKECYKIIELSNKD